MKKSLLILVALLACTGSAMAWGRLGHAAVVAVAQRHLTEKAKENIAKYMNYDLKKDAVWMDEHRRDEPIAYTTSWHVYNVDSEAVYDPNPRLYKGDCVFALKVSDYNLSQYERLTDSAVVMNLRMVLHFAGDLHCPTHSYVPGPRCFWECKLNGKKQKAFHGVYDRMPNLLWGKIKPDELAAQLDNCKKGEIRKIQKGDFHAWAHECGLNNRVIYEWNPHNTYDLNPNTVELSRDLVSIQIRNAGYRLAYLLNKYFDKK